VVASQASIVSGGVAGRFVERVVGAILSCVIVVFISRIDDYLHSADFRLSDELVHPSDVSLS
jgi:hypothetical protein